MINTLEITFGLLHAIIATAKHDLATGDVLIRRDYFREMLELRQKIAEKINEPGEQDD